MQTLAGRTGWIPGLMVVLAATACGSGDDTGPGQTRPTIAKAATKSGDLQTGPVNQPLATELRVVVTRDGEPAPDVVVDWATGSGTLSPSSDKTDLEGVSTSIWTLGGTPGPVSATASIPDATGSPVTFTATATGGPTATIIQVLSEGGTRFSPATITVSTGTTVTWVWGANANGHNVVPDNGSTPASSGALANAPHQYEFTFNTPGTYRYHCQAHGNVGGVGMSGTVTVVDQPSE